MLVLSFKRNESYWSLCFVFGGLLYASTMTSEFAADSAIMVLCFPIAYTLTLFNKFKNPVFSIILIGSLFLFTIIHLGKKLQTPYSWWGLTAKPISSSKFTPPYKQLKGLKVDLATYEVLSKIQINVNSFSKTQNDVYFYPHIPFFYLLHKKLPPTVIQYCGLMLLKIGI